MEEAFHRVGFALSNKVCEPSDVAKLSQHFWHTAFGNSRATYATARIDKGVKRALNDGENAERTEAAFLRKRRRCVQAAADEAIPSLADATEGHMLSLVLFLKM